MSASLSAQTYYVSPNGSDNNSGSLKKPLASLDHALKVAKGKPAKIVIRAGTYYLPEPLVISPESSGTTIAAFADEHPVISGGIELKNLEWHPYRGGILQAHVPDDLRTEELFVNGDRQILARYPNYDPSAKYFDGFAPDAISRERAGRWKNPAGGYFHAMHPALWGDFTWRITGKESKGEVKLEGGWQNNRSGGAHREIRFVENIFEELDSPGEWFLDHHTHILYFYPPQGLDLTKAKFEATRLRSLFELRGTEQSPVKSVHLKGLTFRQAARTVMDTKEPLVRSDWAIYRGAAIFLEGAEDCSVEDCLLDQVGGNGIFVNHYNRRIAVKGCEITKAGASGICFVGDPKSARNVLLNYDQSHKLDEIDLTPGPQSNNYPADCLVENCLINLTGRVEKQTAGVEINLARRITVRHCSIYDMPRAGINIGDGCWGGHVIEFCDVFDTVKETGDHGSFNSWGRDRYWVPDTDEVNRRVKQVPILPKLDALEPVILRNNRWRCDHGWDIDLDDGSSNYVITNNLCLHGGIKNREGFGRVVKNNIMVDSGFHPHVWFAECGDEFSHNIVWTEYQPAVMHPAPWGRILDWNLMHRSGQATIEEAVAMQKQSGRDMHSLVGDAQFMDMAHGDYRVRPGSPALKLGFKNFPMDQFGVQIPKLKSIARRPALPGLAISNGRVSRDGKVISWLGAKVRNIVDEGEMSAFGLPGVTGVLVTEITSGSALAVGGLAPNDVILAINDWEVASVSDLKGLAGNPNVRVSRNQKFLQLRIMPL